MYELLKVVKECITPVYPRVPSKYRFEPASFHDIIRNRCDLMKCTCIMGTKFSNFQNS